MREIEAGSSAVTTGTGAYDSSHGAFPIIGESVRSLDFGAGLQLSRFGNCEEGKMAQSDFSQRDHCQTPRP